MTSSAPRGTHGHPPSRYPFLLSRTRLIASTHIEPGIWKPAAVKFWKKRPVWPERYLHFLGFFLETTPPSKRLIALCLA
jgi:hypothetical protein